MLLRRGPCLLGWQLLLIERYRVERLLGEVWLTILSCSHLPTVMLVRVNSFSACDKARQNCRQSDGGLFRARCHNLINLIESEL